MSDDQQAAREAAITELWISESRMGDPAELTPTNWMNKAFDAGWDARGVWERGRGVPDADWREEAARIRYERACDEDSGRVAWHDTVESIRHLYRSEVREFLEGSAVDSAVAGRGVRDAGYPVKREQSGQVPTYEPFPEGPPANWPTEYVSLADYEALAARSSVCVDETPTVTRAKEISKEFGSVACSPPVREPEQSDEEVERAADAWLAAWEKVVDPEPDPDFPDPCTIKAWREGRILPAVDGTVDQFLGFIAAALRAARREP